MTDMNARLFTLSMLASSCAMAGMEGMFNPMLIANPAANPLAMAAPLGAAAITPGLFGSPFGGLGGYGSPLGMAAPTAGMGAMYPAMQVAPNLMSFQHQAPQMMTNPYMGGPFSQLPLGQSSRPMPFVPAGYGLLPYAQPAPVMTGVPFAGGWGSPPAVPAIPLNPYLMPVAPPAQTQGGALPFNPLDLFRSPAPAAPQPTSPTGGLPFVGPWATSQPTAGTTAAPAPAKATQAPLLSVPFTSPWAQAQTPPAISAPAAVAATKDVPKAAQPTPFDPAYWLAPLKASTAPAK